MQVDDLKVTGGSQSVVKFKFIVKVIRMNFYTTKQCERIYKFLKIIYNFYIKTNWTTIEILDFLVPLTRLVACSSRADYVEISSQPIKHLKKYHTPKKKNRLEYRQLSDPDLWHQICWVDSHFVFQTENKIQN